jgi:hypothetical protein
VSITLEDRGRALEDEFFNKENAKKIEALKEKLDEQRSREDLRKASGMTDDAVLDKLVDLGLSAQTITALSLVPLVTVAWADGSIQDNERNAILQAAHGKNLENGSPGYKLLESWLSTKPDGKLLDAWEAYMKALAGQLNDEQNRMLRNQIVGFAKLIAESAGGILGIGKVAKGEEQAIARIEAAFKR